MSERPAYDYRVLRVDRIIDGDTLDLWVDLGFRTQMVTRVRLAHVDAPERGESNHRQATTQLTLWVANHPYLRVRTYKEDSFRRWIADLYDADTGDSASSALLASGTVVLWRK